MITEIQAKSIKQVLGAQYSPKIIDHLNKKKIYNSNNESFKPKSIQKIMKGTQPNEIVEVEIFRLVKLVKKHKEKELQNRKEILKK